MDCLSVDCLSDQVQDGQKMKCSWFAPALRISIKSRLNTGAPVPRVVYFPLLNAQLEILKEGAMLVLECAVFPTSPKNTNNNYYYVSQIQL